MRLRRFDDANLWSGVYRSAQRKRSGGLEFWRRERQAWESQVEHNVVPTLVVILRLRYWSLPLTISVGGHLLDKPGVTVGIGPVYFSWNLI